jgi:hypothetical protein
LMYQLTLWAMRFTSNPPDVMRGYFVRLLWRVFATSPYLTRVGSMLVRAKARVIGISVSASVIVSAPA